MTASLVDELANVPEPEPDPGDVWGAAVFEEDETPQEKPKRRYRRRQPKVDEDGNEIKTPVTRVPRAAKLKEELLEPLVSLATDLATVAPTVSGVLIVRAERTVDGMVDLASGHKRTMAALSKVAKFSKGADVLETVLLVLFAAAVDFGRIPVNSPLLDHLGHVEIARDAAGKAKRDPEDGKIIKEKITLREIYDKMHPELPESGQDGPPPMPSWDTPSTMAAPLRPPIPMNNYFMDSQG